MYDLGIGILVFNPHDDEEHKERIANCLSSIIKAIEATDKKIKLLVLLNQAVIGNDKQVGVGKETKEMVEEMLHSSHTNYSLLAKRFPNSMIVASYHKLQTELHQVEKSDKVVVFADDYIVPTRWIDIVFNEFKCHKWAEFVTPSTVFVSQIDLLVPLNLQPQWQLAKYRGDISGIRSGICLKDVNEIAATHQNRKTIVNESSNSFETTIFSNRFLTTHGYVHPEYFSIWYNNEYFSQARKNGARGVISRRAFVFHYGKGGTASIHPQTRDEKYKGSAADKYLKQDVDIYNKRNNANASYSRESISYFKQKKPSRKNISFDQQNQKIEKRIRDNDRHYPKQLLKVYANYILRRCSSLLRSR